MHTTVIAPKRVHIERTRLRGKNILLANVNDETRAGERALNLKLGAMWSGAGPCKSRSLPARCLWRLDRLFQFERGKGNDVIGTIAILYAIA